MANEPSDARLVERTLDGDSGAYAELVGRYRRAALARALAILADPSDAEDAAQDAFVQAYDQLGTCRDPARVGAWMLTIAHRTALNRARTIRRRRLVPIEHASELGSVPRDRAEQGELRHRLLDALRELSPVQREVVLLADLEDWPHAEIAEKTGISITMSRRHLSDARKKLRQLLGDVLHLKPSEP